VPSSRSASPISRSSEGEPALGHPAAALAYKLAIAPLLVVQAIRTRRRALVLPEAAGPREGCTPGIGEPLRLLIAGDSSAAGVGVAHQDEAVTGHLVRALQRGRAQPIRWSLRAKSGLTTRGLHRLHEADPPPAADIAVVITGVNDVVDQIGAARALRHRAALADWLLAGDRAGHVVFAPLPPIHRFPLLPEPLRAVLGRDARRHDRVLADWAATRCEVSHAAFGIELNADTMASDGFHPGEPVYRACGEGLAAHLAGRLP
jgi:lysophospholipase L1-like esterase